LENFERTYQYKTKKQVDPLELKTDAGKILTSATNIAQELNKHFASIGPKMAESITSGIQYYQRIYEKENTVWN